MTAYREGVAAPEDAVRSLRVASTLLDRYRALTATHALSSDELELIVGEAQQIYPEIWRHLGDARKSLTALGRDVSAFDAVRRSELVELGVTDIDIHSELDVASLLVGRYRETVVKTVTFNAAGYSRARQGATALMAAMPEVDFAALARAEDAEIKAAGSLQASKWRNVAIAAVVLIALMILASKTC
jgi:hypothetical protein